MRVLVLGGTTEGRLLAGNLVGAHEVTVSLAGRVRAPLPLPGSVRVGGFGGVDGLAAWLREHRTGAVVDATHPFASTMTAHAAAACAAAGVPLLRLQRPAWAPVPDDVWHVVECLPCAARRAADLGERVFLTTGRTGLAAFAPVDRWYLVRSVEPPEPPHPARMEVLLDRGPFTLDGELALLRAHRVDVLVSKNSGGDAPKLAAARTLGLPVVMVARPPLPDGVRSAPSVAAAAEWVASR